MRWLAYGLFSSHSRLHGSSSYRVPWVYGEEAAKVLAKYLDAKHRLMPYLYSEVLLLSSETNGIFLTVYTGNQSTSARAPIATGDAGRFYRG